MVGEFEDSKIKGIIPRAFDYIFERIAQYQKDDPTSKFSVNIAFIQIYIETIQDLFDTRNAVKIREDPEHGVYLENCLWIKVTNTSQCAEAFKNGEKNRVTECTKMNAHSSRSHALLIAKIEKSFSDQDSNEHVMTKSMLYLVDLAGSERVNKTKAKDMRLEEAKKINYSLLVLGNCISSLTDAKSTHVSYRDSKLTRILQESLGGNAKTSLIVTISPSNYNAEETISSLNFGLRAMKVQNKPMINKTEDYKAQCLKLQEDYDRIVEAYSKLKIDYDKVVDENTKLKNGEIFLDLQKKSLKNRLEGSDDEDDLSSLGKTKKKPSQEVEELKKKYSEDMKKLEAYYQEVIKSKEEENNKMLKEVDDELVRKETEISNLKSSNSELKYQNQTLSENLNDLTKETEDLQKSLNDILYEKESLEHKIADVAKEKDVIQANADSLMKKIKEEEIKKSKVKITSSQTDSLIDMKTKDLLLNIKVSKDDIIMNRYDKILNQLIITIDTLSNDSAMNAQKVKKLNESIGQIQKSYEEKLKSANDQMTRSKEQIANLTEEKTQHSEEKKGIKSQYEKEISKMQNKLTEMEQKCAQNKREMTDFQKEKKLFEKKIYDMQNDNKLLVVNAQSASADYKQLQNACNLNEKKLNRNVNMLMNDMVIYNQYKNEVKKIDSIFETDIPSATNQKGFEFVLNKLKTQTSKFSAMMEDLTSGNISLSQQAQSLDTSKSIEKLNENLADNKALIQGILMSYTKLAKNFYDNLRTNTKYRGLDSNNEISNLEKNAGKKNENFIKNNVVLLIKQNLEKFSPLCNRKIDDLNARLGAVSSQIEKLSAQDFIKATSAIFGDFILRISSVKDSKDLEIENLNQKIIFLLRELDIYRKGEKGEIKPRSISNSKLLNNTNQVEVYLSQLELKDEQIDRLNQAIEENLTKIKELSCENSLLKTQSLDDTMTKKTATESVESRSSQDLENKINEYKKEINQINDKLAQLKDQQMSETLDKEIKHKNDYYKERLKKNIKKK